MKVGTWGWEIVDELKPQPGELVCQKTRYDGFYGTSLEHWLSRVWDADSVVIVGTVSNICVLHTAASAGLRFFRLVMPADGGGADDVWTGHDAVAGVVALSGGRGAEHGGRAVRVRELQIADCELHVAGRLVRDGWGWHEPAT